MTTMNADTTNPDTIDQRTMAAVVQAAYGVDPEPTLQYGETPRPVIDADEVLVRVRAASVDRGTWHVMSGQPYLMRVAGFGLRAPKALNPGRCLAGTVEAVGSAVTGFAPGDEVYGTSTGSFAEYCAVRPGKLAAKPANLSFEQAAALPVSAVTALQAVRDHGRVQAGQRVLVTGASGGVGTFAVQIAKAFGAEVTAVCSAGKADLVRSLGADHVLDYAAHDYTRGEERYDVILDIAGNRRLSDIRRVLTPHGVLVLVGGESGGRWTGGVGRLVYARLLSMSVRQTLRSFVASENAADLDALRDLVESGQLTPAIDRAFPLAEVPAAIRWMLDGRARGKVVITTSAR
jgi:NADPH:quinone reductase-like Zn-dependent oxidoreductase